MLPKKSLNIQGHRGARGLFPENTLTAFIEAVKLGVDTLEIDVVISKDKHVVVSHEAWMNPDFCSKPNGEAIEKNSEQFYNLYKMNYAEIKKFDCGKKTNTHFPLQKSIPEYKPLLSEVIAQVELYIKTHHLQPVTYNIEIKSEPKYDYTFNPEPKAFVDLAYEEVKKQSILNRTILQSFDVRILNELYKKDATLTLALLVENENELSYNLSRLQFKPAIYAPEFNLVNEQLVSAVHDKNMQLIPWTVNEINDMKQLIKIGVDGIITDYPDRLINLVRPKF